MVKTVGVIGAGQMGNGIAHVFALSGYEVIICDINEDALKKAITTIEKNLNRQISKEIITAQDGTNALAAIRTSNDLKELKDVDLAI